MRIVLACLVMIVAQSSFAAPRAQLKRSSRPPMQKTAYAPRDTQAPRYGVSSSISGSRDSKLEVRAGLGKVYGLQPIATDGDATVFGADLLYKVTRQFYIPFGISRWESEPELGTADYDMDGRIRLLTVDSGVGYNVGLTQKLTMPLGLRLGWYRMDMKFDFASRSDGASQRGTFKFEDQGKHISPTMGLLYQMSPSLALGYEVRIPILASHNASDDEDDDDDDDEEEAEEGDDADGVSIPSYQMFMLSLKL